jgi:DNA-binding transcriptional LysR family regulator
MVSVRAFDLNLLVLFDALYRERQLSAAAAAVGLSQPAASQALSRLRDALGDPLFVRRGRGMEPTALAESLAPALRGALHAIEQALLTTTQFDASKSEREFRIGLGEAGEMFFFSGFLATVNQSAPRVRLRSVLVRDVDLTTASLRGELDLAFDFELPTDPSLRHVALGSEEIVVIARRDHPRIQGSVTVPSLMNESRVRLDIPEERWRRLLVLLGVPLPEITGGGPVVGAVSQIVSIPAIVAETDSLALVPRVVAELPVFAGRLQVLPPPIPLRPLPVFAFWQESFDADPGHRWLRSFLVQHFWRK